ncbi:unnamed protein product [Symbiodinium sp. CCMP2456]|nr:unnamed protein product [Symbiodinium sp. CCMP2456]
MQTMWIVGWQAKRTNGFGSSHYSKDEALYFRTEKNPVVGQTKAGIFRSAGHPIYEHKEGDKIFRYFFNRKGTQRTVDEDAWLAPRRTFCLFLGEPDRELMSLVDAMLGQDVCGPSHFCEKVGKHETQNNLAPFGAEQKCKAVGAADHEAADLEISKKLEDIKGSVLDLAEKMEQSEAIMEKDSSRSS